MAETVRKRKPVAGALWGLSLGLGLGLLAINAKLIDLAIVPFVIVTLAGIVIGVLWGMYGPAKKPKGPPPAGASPQPEPADGPPIDVDDLAGAGDAGEDAAGDASDATGDAADAVGDAAEDLGGEEPPRPI